MSDKNMVELQRETRRRRIRHHLASAGCVLFAAFIISQVAAMLAGW